MNIVTGRWPSDKELLAETIRRARDEGDPESARNCLNLIVTAIYHEDFRSPLFHYLAECIELYLQDVSLERAFGIEKQNKGGRPQKYDPDAITSIDILLRRDAGFSKEVAIDWISRSTGIDRRQVQRMRDTYAPKYARYLSSQSDEFRDRDTLLHDLNDMPEKRKKVAEVLPHT